MPLAFCGKVVFMKLGSLGTGRAGEIRKNGMKLAHVN